MKEPSVARWARKLASHVRPMGALAAPVAGSRYQHAREEWQHVAARVAINVVHPLLPDMAWPVACGIASRRFLPGGRYLWAAGLDFHQYNNCFLLRAGDSREAWGDLMRKATLALMTGGGIGVDYSPVREEGALLRRSGGKASGPIPLMMAVNEMGRQVRQGGVRRSAIWAGLSWKHPDILKFIHAKDWPDSTREAKAKDFNFPAPLDMTNISVLLDDEFFHAFHSRKHPMHAHAHGVYWETVRQMLRTGEPGFSVDVGVNAGETLRNACTEVTSRDTDDVCNLASPNLGRMETTEELEEASHAAMALQMCGTILSDVPYPEVAEVRARNRRVGQGLMGIHEWLLRRGQRYGMNPELERWLGRWSAQTDDSSVEFAKKLGVNVPVKRRAIAPNGTIGIVAETTTGIEPLFCAAYERRYMVGTTEWRRQVVLDPVATRLADEGVRLDDVEDAYGLAADPARRVDFQVAVQRFVDHGISSTINLPAWGSELNNEDRVRPFGEMLIERLPGLRGITCYPDGARGGQPLTALPFAEARTRLNQVQEAADACTIGKGGTCGE